MEGAAGGHRRTGTKGRPRRGAASPARVVTEIAITSVVCGAALGVAWFLLAPQLTGQVAQEGMAIPFDQARQLFSREAVFSFLGAGTGLVLGVLFGVRHRQRPVSTLLALAFGGAGGSLLALGVGIVLGPSTGDAEPGTEVTLPMALDAPAALLVWPVVGVIVVAVMSLFRDDRTPWSWNGQ